MRDTDRELGQRILELRKERDLTQAELHDMLVSLGSKLDRSALSRIESGGRTVRATEIFLIARALDVSADALDPGETTERLITRLERRLEAIATSVRNLGYEADGITAHLEELRTEGETA